jgi:hypothetical protein
VSDLVTQLTAAVVAAVVPVLVAAVNSWLTARGGERVAAEQ